VEIDGANECATPAALEMNDDSIRGQATQSANEEQTDNISSDKAIQAVATAPKPFKVRREEKRPTTELNPGTITMKKKRASCKKGTQINIRRDNLNYILTSDKQKEDIEKCENNRNHGEIITGKG